MDLLKIDSDIGKKVYLEILNDLVSLLCDFRDKVKEEIKYDEL